MTATKKSVASSVLELVVIVATALGLALAIQAFVVKPYRIPSASMLPTLHINQRLLVNRLGTIPRNAENATAAAFRTSLLQTVMADNISAGAIAAPLVTPGGCVGVMAAEVMHDSERQDMKLAAATIVRAAPAGWPWLWHKLGPRPPEGSP